MIPEWRFPSCGVCVDRVIAEGFRCIRVFSVMDSPVAKLVQEGTVLEFDATFQLDDRCVCVCVRVYTVGEVTSYVKVF